MKKNYISLSLMAIVALNSNIFAQAPTITVASMPQVGFIYEMMSDTTPADLPTFTVSAGSSTAQTWNYASFFANTYVNPTSFVAPAGNPGASSFPSANLAANQNGSWAYFISGATGLFIDGVDAVITSTTTAVLDFNPNETLIPVPYTYSNTTNNIYAATANVTVSGFPATISHRANRTITADAFGSLTTPTATYSNTLRLKTYEITSDSAFVLGNNVAAYNQYDTTITYTWLQNTQDAQLMVINLAQNGTLSVTKAQYLQSLQFAGINTVKKTETLANLYPNPTSGVTYLSYENQSFSNVSAAIFDVTGRQVATLLNNQQQTSGKQTLTIDVNNLQLPQGLYMVQLTLNGAMKTLKLNVQ